MSQLLFFAAAAVSGLFGRVRLPLPPRVRSWSDDRRSIVPYVCGLGIAFIVHAAAISYAALTQIPFPTWLLNRPLVPILDTAPLFAHTSSRVSVAIEIVSIVETVLLIGLAFATRRRLLRPAEKLIASALFAAMALYSLFARGTASADLYAYVADARLGIACYAGASSFASGPFHIVEYFWGHPMIPCAYGPVWIWFVHVFLGWVPTPQGSIIGLRLLSLVTFLAALKALARLEVGAMFLLPLALDPALILQYVADGHNDFFGIALLLWARCFAVSGNALLASLLAACAGASKVPFLPISMLTFVDRKNIRVRVGYGMAALLGGLLISLAFGGPAYLKALGTTAAIYPTSSLPGGIFLPRVALTAILVTIGIALSLRRVAWPAAWGFASLGSLFFPWYLAWGIPYAAIDPDVAWPFLVSLPILVFSMSTTYSATMLSYPLVAILPVAVILLYYFCTRGLVRIRA